MFDHEMRDAAERVLHACRKRKLKIVTAESCTGGLVAATLTAIYEYADSHPGVLRAAMSDERVIDADGVEARPLLMQWGAEWAEMLRCEASNGGACASYDADIIGQAIVGALHQASWECHRSGRSREEMVKNLTAFLTRALKPV